MLLLARHGVTELNELGRVQGSTDHPLSPRGIEQAKRLSQWLADASLGTIKVYTSPARRALQTAELVTNHLQVVRPIIIPGIHERSFGPFEGLNQDEILTLRGLPADTDPDIIEKWSSVPGVEPDVAVSGRLQMALKEHQILAQAQENNVLIVSHSGVIELLLQIILGLPLIEGKWIKITPTCCIGISLTNTKARLRFFHPNADSAGH